MDERRALVLYSALFSVLRSGIVAGGILLHLDDVGPHVRKHQSAHRARHDVGELDDLDAGERSHLSGR